MRLFQILGNQVNVVKDEQFYSDTVENYLLDGGIVEKDGENMTVAVYDSQQDYCEVNGVVLPYPNEFFENIIDGIETLLAKKAEREYVEPTLEERKTAKHNAAGAAFAAKRDAIRFIKISDGNTYGFDCANEDITNFFASWKAAEKVGETPYKVWMSETTKGMIMLPLADFDTVFDVVRNSQLEAYAWYNATAAAIEAATTKEELEAIILD